MRSVNKVVLMGHLAADPEVKVTVGGQKMARFSVVTNRDWKGGDGESRQAADFHKIIVWQKLAELCADFLKKGAAVYLEGRLSNHKFQDKEGNKRTTTEIVADLINFISYKKNKEGEEVNLLEMPA